MDVGMTTQEVSDGLTIQRLFVHDEHVRSQALDCRLRVVRRPDNSKVRLLTEGTRHDLLEQVREADEGDSTRGHARPARWSAA